MKTSDDISRRLNAMPPRRSTIEQRCARAINTPPVPAKSRYLDTASNCSLFEVRQTLSHYHPISLFHTHTHTHIPIHTCSAHNLDVNIHALKRWIIVCINRHTQKHLVLILGSPRRRCRKQLWRSFLGKLLPLQPRKSRNRRDSWRHSQTCAVADVV